MSLLLCLGRKNDDQMELFLPWSRRKVMGRLKDKYIPDWLDAGRVTLTRGKGSISLCELSLSVAIPRKE